MSCPTCKNTEPLIKCADEIILGLLVTYDDALIVNEPLYCYIRHVGTGRIQRIECDSDAYTAEVTIQPDFTLTAEQDYEVWLTAQDGNKEDREYLRVEVNGSDETEIVQCLYLRFESVFEEDQNTEHTPQTVKLCSNEL
jgi:alpha-L-arabinofuranosidase